MDDANQDRETERTDQRRFVRGVFARAGAYAARVVVSGTVSWFGLTAVRPLVGYAMRERIGANAPIPLPPSKSDLVPWLHRQRAAVQFNVWSVGICCDC